MSCTCSLWDSHMQLDKLNCSTHWNKMLKTDACKSSVCRCGAQQASETLSSHTSLESNHERTPDSTRTLTSYCELINNERERLLKHSPASLALTEWAGGLLSDLSPGLRETPAGKALENHSSWSALTVTCWLKDCWWKGKRPLKQLNPSEVPHQTQVEIWTETASLVFYYWGVFNLSHGELRRVGQILGVRLRPPRWHHDTVMRTL